ncbi:MAG TPA: hypothetical protein VFF12_15810 [Myxococcaceae bacterium]|nr:hypothetical protein [Myxococcaceae bacterium]
MRGPWSLTAALLLLTAAACRRTGLQEPAADAGTVVTALPAPDAGLEFTVAKLDGFLAYERLLRGEPAPSVRQIQRLAQAADGGGRALEEAYAGLQRRTERAQALRADAGLSTAEVQALESLTAEVALARAGAGGPELEEALRALETAKDQLPAEQRAGVERTVKRLREQQERAKSLSEVRSRWGDAAVDTVLAREKAVLELWGVPSR